MEAVAPAATLGGREVVKMNPGAYPLTASTIFSFAAMYPPKQPIAVSRLLEKKSISC